MNVNELIRAQIDASTKNNLKRYNTPEVVSSAFKDILQNWIKCCFFIYNTKFTLITCANVKTGS